MSLHGETLNFRWASTAAGVPANVLRNCGLLASVGSVKKLVAFSPPQTVAPLKLDLDRASVKISLPRDALPDPGALRLQVTGIEGPLPPHEMKNGDTAAAKSKIEISFKETKLPPTTLRLGFETKPKIASLDMALLSQPLGQQKPASIQFKNIDQMASLAKSTRDKLQVMVNKLQDKDPRKKPLTEQLAQLNTAAEQWAALRDFYKAVNQKVAIHFRIYCQFSNYQIDLFTTKPPEQKTPK